MGYIYGENFKRIGRVDPDGKIYNEKSEYIGRIADDGYILDTLFNRVGHIESDGRIFNEKLEYLGRVIIQFRIIRSSGKTVRYVSNWKWIMRAVLGILHFMRCLIQNFIVKTMGHLR